MRSRFTTMLAALAALAACSRPAAPPAQSASVDPPADCNLSARTVVAFTAPDAQDVVETHAFGPDCDKAVVQITVRKADGSPLWAWASTRGWPGRPAPSAPGAASADPLPPAAMAKYLAEWSKARVDTTAALPDWPQRDNVFKDQLGAFLNTPFDRDQYLDIRTKALPRLCFATGVESGECIYFDDKTGAALKVLDSGA